MVAMATTPSAFISSGSTSGNNVPLVFYVLIMSEFSAERNETVAMQCWAPDTQA